MPISTEITSLAQWSQERIRSVFEAATEEEALKAINETFSRGVKARVNGLLVGYAQIEQQVLDLRRTAEGGLKVHWKEIIESENAHPQSQEGQVGGFYHIQGIRKPIYKESSQGGSLVYGDFVRHKAVSAKIVSERTTSNLDVPLDARRIVELTVIAKDVPVDSNENASYSEQDF
ncbi:hypothetical protein CC1G_11648 [Coprinopsis cinerea okayama7|uniref:Uncharacterized protein n=1 Tax=Coprinopsis cinerea (strain Okayama-7 / 130 / ATCC MYA-4618 / FGSC 9003) TaxID=240176 RepID=A8P493_COPC7|nr:hypothetical protein CC1G_11648 [Coprinopsis cinerea okayama7\|eukprot:XP_001838705.1 hypothetical protein CC1G_11648 [Coprinopsis cinerea okayama7\